MASAAGTEALPVILCLHGGGSNATVFKIQCRRLMWALSSQFRFIFVNGPFTSEAGLGMLPVFETCAPFYRWSKGRYVDGLEYEVMPVDEVVEVQQVLDEVVERECGEQGGWQNVAGVLGFSMGARFALGLLMKQILSQKGRLSVFLADDVNNKNVTNFKFGVIIGCPYPPLSPLPGMTLTTEDYELLQEIPTVHAWGEDDVLKESAEKLADVCEGAISSRMEFEGGHHLPLVDAQARELCDLIRAAWYVRGGRAQEFWKKQMQGQTQ